MIQDIQVLVLRGTKYEMGLEYGMILKEKLYESLAILIDFFVIQKGINQNKLVEKSHQLYERFLYEDKKFIQGVADGSGLSLHNVIMLNGMETLLPLIYERNTELSACTFVAIPKNKSVSGGTIIGRNYDFPGPFDQIARYLTVTILYDSDLIPTAFISMPGQIYCPTCVNSKAIAIAFNNGTPSAGAGVNSERISLLTNLLHALQNSETIAQLEKQLLTINPDYSLIVNTVSRSTIKSYEFSAHQGLKTFTPDQYKLFVSTNFYLNSTWNAPTPYDNTTWQGVTRRDNLLNGTEKEFYTVYDVQKMLDKGVEYGGAATDLTIYHVVFDLGTMELYVKRAKFDETWFRISLDEEFNNALPLVREYCTYD